MAILLLPQAAATSRHLRGAPAAASQPRGMATGCARSVSLRCWRARHLGLRATQHQQNRRCVVRMSASDIEPELMETWDRMKLLTRQMDIAIDDEDYDRAAKVRDERSALVGTIDERTEELLQCLSTLKMGSTPERLDALQALVKLGDKRCVRTVLDCLHDEEVAAAAESAVWEIFCQSGDDQVDNLLTDGMLAMREPESWEQAVRIFTKVIELRPNFAEGYNKRATVLYMLKKYPEAIADCHRTVELQPDHFGALSGLGLCHCALGDVQDAIVAFRGALRVNPRLQQILKYLEDLEEVQENAS